MLPVIAWLAVVVLAAVTISALFGDDAEQINAEAEQADVEV